MLVGQEEGSSSTPLRIAPKRCACLVPLSGFQERLVFLYLLSHTFPSQQRSLLQGSHLRLRGITQIKLLRAFLTATPTKNLLFGTTASGFGISAGTPLFLSSRPCKFKSVHKRKQGDSSLYHVFAGRNCIITQSPLSSWSYLLAGQVFSHS